MAANEVVYFSSDETGAPVLNNAVGSMIDVLDACLINGYNAKSVTSVVVTGNVATATISAHGYETGRIVEFAGAAPSGLNGRKKVTVTGSNTVTFPAPGISDQTASGTITAKRPPLGYTKLFSATGKAIYQRNDVTATAMVLRVDDTNSGASAATYARVKMVEAAADIDTVTNPAPTAAHANADGLYWSKGVNNSSAKQWVLVGDGRTFYLFTDQDSYTFASYGCLHMRTFGDLGSYRVGDAYACTIGGDTGYSAESNFPGAYSFNSPSSNNGWMAARAVNGIDLIAYLSFFGPSNGGVMGGAGPLYPSPVDNGLVIQSRVPVCEYSSTFQHPIRGHARGLLMPLATISGRLHKRVLSNLTDFAGDVLMVGIMTQGSPGCVALDLTGPWA